MGATVGQPLRHATGRVSSAIDEVRGAFGTTQNVDKATAKKIEKEKEEKKEARKEAVKNAVKKAKIGANIVWAGAAGFLSIPLFIVEPAMGIRLLSSVDSSTDRIIKLKNNAASAVLFCASKSVVGFGIIVNPFRLF